MFNKTCDLLYLFVHTTIFKINLSLEKEYYAIVLKEFIESFFKKWRSTHTHTHTHIHTH